MITNRSWKIAILNDKFFWTKLLENKEMDFKNGAINIQAAGYNGAHMVPILTHRSTTSNFYVNKLFSSDHKIYICFALLRLVQFAIITYKFFLITCIFFPVTCTTSVLWHSENASGTS